MVVFFFCFFFFVFFLGGGGRRSGIESFLIPQLQPPYSAATWSISYSKSCVSLFEAAAFCLQSLGRKFVHRRRNC